MSATSKNNQTGEISNVGDITAARRWLAFSPDQNVKIILPTMQFSRIGAAGVVDSNGKLCGMLTEREILRQIFKMVDCPIISPANVIKHVEDMTVRDVMITGPKCLNEDTDIEDALEFMTELGFRFMPVVSRHDSQKLIGVVDEREVAIHVKNRLDRVKREAAEKESVLHYLFREPYGVGFDPKM